MKTAETFADLISPVSTEEFFERYWERGYLHLRNGPGRFAKYFSTSESDRWLSSLRTGQANGVMITHDDDQGEVRAQNYRPQDLAYGTLYEAIAQRASVVMNHMEDYPSLSGLVRSLAKDFHADIGVNAYLTPPNARTFPIHTDEHDVLVLHLEGEKVWHLHDFSLMQLKLKQKKNLQFTEEWYGRTETPEVAEILIKPGDLLFIPRGMPHYAVATDSACLHLTISITPLYWMDVLKIAAEHAAVHSPAVRRALPPGFVSDDAKTESMREHFDAVLADFQKYVTFDEVIPVVKRNLVTFQGLPADGHVQQLLQLDQMEPCSLLERRPDVLCTVDEILDVQRNRRCAIFFGPHRMAGPLHLRRAFEFIRVNDQFRVSEIPGLDEKSQLVLARRLLREGLLRFASRDGAAERVEEEKELNLAPA